ncbi:MAG: hypothetical protein WCO71_08765 [Pseudomonadota bacterium]
MKHKNFCIALFAFLASLAITTAVIAQVKAAPTVPPKTNTYADPARCKKRYDGTASQVPELLRCVYEPYLDSNSDYGNSLSSAEVIYIFASFELRKLINAQGRCQRREQGICGPDHNFLIAGQDWAPLQGFNVQFDKTTRRANIKFKNCSTRIRVTFVFGIEDQRWVIRDIINDQIDPDDKFGPDSYYYALTHLE